MGVLSVDPRARVGTYVSPSEWNAVVDDPDTLLIDTRNRYEVAIGSFEGAVDPGTDSFREFPEWVEKELRSLVESRAPVDCHVLHWWHPLRESQQLSDAERFS